VRRIVNWSFERPEVCRVTSLLVMLERSGVARAGALLVKGTNGTNGTFLAFREVAHLTVTATGVGVSFNRRTLLCS
jgi:hypothetical protein